MNNTNEIISHLHITSESNISDLGRIDRGLVLDLQSQFPNREILVYKRTGHRVVTDFSSLTVDQVMYIKAGFSKKCQTVFLTEEGVLVGANPGRPKSADLSPREQAEKKLAAAQRLVVKLTEALGADEFEDEANEEDENESEA